MTKKTQSKTQPSQRDKKQPEYAVADWAVVAFSRDIYKRYGNFATLAVLGTLCAIYILRNNNMFLFEGGDNAYYIFLAKAILAGKGYRETFVVGAPIHTQFPPLFPLILAAIIALRGTDVYLMKLVITIGATATFVLTFILLRRRSFAWPLAAIVWLGCSYRLFSYTDSLLTEPLFMAFAASTLLGFDRWRENGRWKDAALMILSCWAAEMTRTAGMPLAAAIGMATFIQTGKSKKSAIKGIVVMLVCLLPVFLWGIREGMVSTQKAGYISQLLAVDPYDPTKGVIGLGDLLTRFLENVHTYFIDSVWLLAGERKIESHGVIWVLAVFFWMSFLLGLISKLRKNPGVIEMYTVFFLAMCSIWPFVHYRFILPVYPFIMAYVVEGASFVVSLVSSKRSWKQAALLFYAIVFITVVSFNTKHSFEYQKELSEYFDTNKLKIDDNIYAVSPWPDYGGILKASIWLARNAEPDAIVMARKPSLTALASEHVILPCPLVVPDDPKKWLLENKVRYILVDEAYPNSLQFMNALTRGGKDVQGLRIGFSDNHTFVVEITPSFFEQ